MKPEQKEKGYMVVIFHNFLDLKNGIAGAGTGRVKPHTGSLSTSVWLSEFHTVVRG